MAEQSEYVDLLQSWAEALRGTKYKHNPTLLRSDSGFNICGVLCDLYDSSKWYRPERMRHYSYDLGGFWVWSLPSELFDEIVVMTGVSMRKVSRMFAEVEVCNNCDENGFIKAADVIEKFLKEHGNG